MRHRSKQPETTRSYAASWAWYVRGNVVSRHAAKIIVQFMAACSGSSKRTEDKYEDAKEDASAKVLPNSDLALQRVHDILDRMSAADVQNGRKAKASKDEEQEISEDNMDAKALEQSSQINDAMKLTAKLWSRTQQSWPHDNLDVRTSTLKASPELAAHKAAKIKNKKQKQRRMHPKAKRRKNI